jgi:Zn-finger protein
MKEKEEAKRIIELYKQIETPVFDCRTGKIEQQCIGFYSAKQCALIHVESLIKEIRLTVQYCRIIEVETLGDRITFLEKVKQQIENY